MAQDEGERVKEALKAGAANARAEQLKERADERAFKKDLARKYGPGKR